MYKGIGLMSGTSLDGLDMAYCQFELINGCWHYEILAAELVTYPADLREKLSLSKTITAAALASLDIEYSRWLGECAKRFIKERKLEVDFIASHGCTVFHQPEKSLTQQLGSGYEIYAQCQLPVVFNFRQLDIALGGQGAPLVPIGDQLLFSSYDFCLNLGGIANLSTEHKGRRIAYDVCPANMILNHQAKRMGLEYDKGGVLAASGSIISDLFSKLEHLKYYQAPYPKSLGSEWVDANILELNNLSQHKPADTLATFTAHIASCLAHDIRALSDGMNKSVLVTGGGAWNETLIGQLRQNLEGSHQLSIPDSNTVNYKEALIFAFLGLLRLRNECNCLASATGARRDSCGGLIVNEQNIIL